ncbi:MAG: PAS/PAC sensor hybrid histidine kinase [bacterium]|nr:MAG: PAS/PAC sensor hybrid histidine kinase [bacterium]
MKRALQILYVEDNPNDAELVEAEILASDISFDILRVDNKEAYLAALEQKTFDLILSDFSMPYFDGAMALKIAREKYPEIPFIYVSGTIGEDAAIESFRNGATDYVLKNRLSKLVPVIKRVLQENEEKLKRKQVEEQIHQQAMIIDIAPNAIQMLDFEGKILFWSKGAERIYGWLAVEVIEKNVQDLMFKNDVSRFAFTNKTTVEKGEWIGELEQVNKSGKKIIVESRQVLVRGDEGKPKSLLVINTDITERKKLETQFLRAQRMECVGALASGIAHDLNNILAPIILSVQLLKNRLPDEKSQKLLSMLQNSCQRGAELVQQILSFGRGLESEAITLQVGHLVKEVEKIIRETFPKNIRTITYLAKDTWAVSAVTTQIHQLLMNLCVNARDAMPEGGSLTISVENIFVDETYTQINADSKVGPYVCISISDTGEGIAKNILDKIFEPFFTTKEIGKGTGLGLATVVSIVKAHYGFITLESELAKGTRFKVYLPATDVEETPKSRLAPHELFNGQGELILVVDDEGYIREITKTALEVYNYHVLTASDGSEALTIYLQEKEKISLVITDLIMPFMDGVKTIEALRRINPQIKIIVVSGVARNSITTGIEYKADAMLAKPYTTEQLLKTVRQTLDGTTTYTN